MDEWAVGCGLWACPGLNFNALHRPWRKWGVAAVSYEESVSERRLWRVA